MALRRFIIERDIPKVGSFERQQLREAAMKSNEGPNQLAPHNQWVERFVRDDKTFFVSLAKDEEVIRKHAEVSGFPPRRSPQSAGSSTRPPLGQIKIGCERQLSTGERRTSSNRNTEASVIRATCHTADDALTVEFDATPWFREAAPASILQVAGQGWSRAWIADGLEKRPGYERLHQLIDYATNRLGEESLEDRA